MKFIGVVIGVVLFFILKYTLTPTPLVSTYRTYGILTRRQAEEKLKKEADEREAARIAYESSPEYIAQQEKWKKEQEEKERIKREEWDRMSDLDKLINQDTQNNPDFEPVVMGGAFF